MSALSVKLSPPWELTELGTVSSTNNVMKTLARAGAPEGSILTAVSQTAGRGRLERSFVSPEKGLYMSVLLRPHCESDRLPTLTPCAALAVRRAIVRVCGVRCDIKWPNDLLYGGKKLCGILTESVIGLGETAVCVGIGINVNTQTAALPEEACSLLGITGRETDIPALARTVISELRELLRRWYSEDETLLTEYRALCLNIGRECELLRGGSRIAVTVRDVAKDFSLLVDRGGESERIGFGEVSLRTLDKKRENEDNRAVRG